MLNLLTPLAEALKMSKFPVLLTIKAACPPAEGLISTLPVPFGVMVRTSLAAVVMSVVMPENVRLDVSSVKESAVKASWMSVAVTELIIRVPSEVIESELTARAPELMVTPPAVTVRLSARVKPPVALKSVPALPMFWIRLALAFSVPAKVKAERVSAALSKVIPPLAAIAPEAVRVVTPVTAPAKLVVKALTVNKEPAPPLRGEMVMLPVVAPPKVRSWFWLV